MDFYAEGEEARHGEVTTSHQENKNSLHILAHTSKAGTTPSLTAEIRYIRGTIDLVHGGLDPTFLRQVGKHP
jgi:hypothetical protein